MKFAKNNVNAVDFSTLNVNDVASATFKSFNFRKEYIVGTFVADNQSVQAIIGTKNDYKVADLLPLKGAEVEITYGGTRVVNGVTYPSYWVAW